MGRPRRKKRPDNTTYLPLLPAQPKPEQSIDSNILQDEPRKSAGQQCGIPLCRNDPCDLPSHRSYSKRLFRLSRSKAILNRFTSYKSRPTVSTSPLPSPSTIELPLGDLNAQQPQLRTLFSTFFTSDMKRIHLLVQPPGSNFSNYMLNRAKQLLQQGFEYKRACLNIIALSYAIHYAEPDSQRNSLSTIGLIIQGQLMEQVRALLDAYDPQSHAGPMITMMMALVVLDLQVGKRDNLHTHKQALIRIIDSRGGLHMAGPAIPFAYNMDMMLATQLNQAPLYTPYQSLTVPIQRTSLYPENYGSRLSCEIFSASFDSDVDQDIRQYSIETCRAIEILEGEQWDFSGDTESYRSSELDYLYFLRNRLIGRFAHLNAKTIEMDTKGRCILLATKLVEYTVLMDTYVQAIPMKVADNLREALCENYVLIFGTDHMDVLLWIMFVLLCMPVRWMGKEWAASLCQQVLTYCYSVNWIFEHDVHSRVLNVLRSFVWSDTRLNDNFRKCWKMLVDEAVHRGGSHTQLPARLRSVQDR